VDVLEEELEPPPPPQDRETMAPTIALATRRTELMRMPTIMAEQVRTEQAHSPVRRVAAVDSAGDEGLHAQG
jgi:hypothetical protein